MRVERYGYLEQTKSASGIARKSWEAVATGNGGLKGVCCLSGKNGGQRHAEHRERRAVPDGSSSVNGVAILA